MGLSDDQIKRAYEIMEAVKSIDYEIGSLVGDPPGILAANGEKIRNVIGCYKISHFADVELGRLINKAIIAALLDRREALVLAHGGWIDFPSPPTTDEATK